MSSPFSLTVRTSAPPGRADGIPWHLDTSLGYPQIIRCPPDRGKSTRWVQWYNLRRLHEACGYLPPAEYGLPPRAAPCLACQSSSYGNETGYRSEAEQACQVCGQRFFSRRRDARYCSPAGAQSAYRLPHQLPPAPPPLPKPLPRDCKVYECPQCQTRSLGEQRCADCGVFCPAGRVLAASAPLRRVGRGRGPWPAHRGSGR